MLADSTLIAPPAPSPNAPSLADARATLERVWGHGDFRGRQAEVVTEILAGRDVVAVLPTGGGKSVCYQIPAMLRPGLGLVVSPLIALMTDQVEALKQQGVAAAHIRQGRDREASNDRVERPSSGPRPELTQASATVSADDLSEPDFRRFRPGFFVLRV